MELCRSCIIKNMRNRTTNFPNKILRIALGTALILSIPLAAMQFSAEVNWDLADFTIIGILLFSAGLLYELIASQLPNKNHRFATGIVILLTVLYIWAELAVGIFTTWGS